VSELDAPCAIPYGRSSGTRVPCQLRQVEPLYFEVLIVVSMRGRMRIIAAMRQNEGEEQRFGMRFILRLVHGAAVAMFDIARHDIRKVTIVLQAVVANEQRRASGLNLCSEAVARKSPELRCTSLILGKPIVHDLFSHIARHFASLLRHATDGLQNILAHGLTQILARRRPWMNV
jgi:hypothetical protein